MPGDEDPMDGDRSAGCLPTAATAPMLGGTSTAGIPCPAVQGEPPHHWRPLKVEMLHCDNLNNFHENSSLQKFLQNQTRGTRPSAAAVTGATSTSQRGVPARWLLLAWHLPAGPMCSARRLPGWQLPAHPSFGLKELGSSAVPRVRQENKLQAGLRPRQAPVARDRHAAASTASASWWAAKEQNRDNGTRGDRNVLHFSSAAMGIGYSNHASRGTLPDRENVRSPKRKSSE